MGTYTQPFITHIKNLKNLCSEWCIFMKQHEKIKELKNK